MSAICMIRCWDCGKVIEDYDPAIDQYTCAKCRAKSLAAFKKKYGDIQISMWTNLLALQPLRPRGRRRKGSVA